MNKDNKIIHFSITVLVVVSIWLCIIGSIYYVTNFIENPNSNIDYLGFIGSIVGGLITLLGVAWTINNDRKLRQIDDENKYMPILYPKLSDNRKSVAITNLGRAEAINIKPLRIAKYNGSMKILKDEFYNIVQSNDDLDCFSGEDTRNLFNLKNNKIDIIYVNVKIEYFNFMKTIKYNLSFDYSINPCNELYITNIKYEQNRIKPSKKCQYRQNGI